LERFHGVLNETVDVRDVSDHTHASFFDTKRDRLSTSALRDLLVQ
jgi:hypothetical protein